MRIIDLKRFFLNSQFSNQQFVINSVIIHLMHRLRSLIQYSVKNSIKWQTHYNKNKHFMEEVEMALMEEPINQINQFSTQKLAHISNTFRVSRQDYAELTSQSLKFDGKLHLDLKIDKILLQIQECKVNLAQILELYLSGSSNSIFIQQLKLSNLKPSFEQESNMKQNEIELEQLGSKSTVQVSQGFERRSSSKTVSDKLSRLRREDSYEINTLKEQQKAQQQAQHLQILNKIGQVQVQEQLKQTGFRRQKESTFEIYNLQEKKEQGKQAAKKLTEELNEQKVSQISSSLLEEEIKNSSGKQLIQKIEKEILNFKKTLMLRQAQLGMLIYITEIKHDQNFILNYQQIYHSLNQYVIPIHEVNQKINLFVLQEVFEIQTLFLNQYLKYIHEIKTRLQDYQNSQHQQIPLYSLTSLTKETPLKKLQKSLKSVLKLKIINSKIITMAEIFPYACIKDANDLFSFSQSHERWRKLIHEDVINYKIYGQPEKVRKSFEALKCNLNIINASMNILNQSKDLSVLNYNSWGKIFDSASKILKVTLFKTDALHEAAVMISEPDGRLAKEIWNLPENKTLQNFISAVLPTIEFSQKIFIPRVLQHFVSQNGKQPLPDQFLVHHITQYGNELFQKAPHQTKIVCRINAKHRIHRRYETRTKDQIQEQAKKKKAESYSKIFFNTLSSMTNAVSTLNSYFKKAGENQSTAVLHIHGGGFISMSSFIHQTYTRNWANNLQVPILSVDYGKAPEYPFPNGLYDCLEAYMWLRFVFRQIYNCEVEKVVIVGDSAGGNLAAALTNLLIKWNLPKPDGLVLVYPALNLNINNYTPSLLHALNDMILPHTFLKICLRAYLKDSKFNPERDPFVSPIAAKASVLKKYPRTKIFVGGKDPFHDDCCRFVQKLNEQREGIADLTIFEEFPHGFLQFDMATYPHEAARKAIKEVELALKQVIEYKEK